MPQKSIKLRENDYFRLKRIADKHGVPLSDMFSEAIKKLEAKKMESKEKDAWVCDECGAEVPENACFCPYCGVEFEDEDEDEE
jgi:rubrerythrin